MHCLLSALLVVGCGAAKPDHKNKNAAEGRLPKATKVKAAPPVESTVAKPTEPAGNPEQQSVEAPTAPADSRPGVPTQVGSPTVSAPNVAPVEAPMSPTLPEEGQLPIQRPMAPAPDVPVPVAPNPDPFDQTQQQLPQSDKIENPKAQGPKAEIPKAEIPKVEVPKNELPDANPPLVPEPKPREEKGEAHRDVLPAGWIPVGWELKSKNGREWSRIAVSIIRQKAPLFYRGSEDIDEFCPSFHSLKPTQKENVWVSLISAMARYESNFDPYTRYYEKKMNRLDLVTGEPLHSEGLLQLSYQDSKSFPKFCSEIDWERDQDLDDKSSKKTIFNPRINLKCGIQVLHRQIGRHNRIAVTKRKAYWAVLIPNGRHSKLGVIQAAVKALPFCRATAD